MSQAAVTVRIVVTRDDLTDAQARVVQASHDTRPRVSLRLADGDVTLTHATDVADLEVAHLLERLADDIRAGVEELAEGDAA